MSNPCHNKQLSLTLSVRFSQVPVGCSEALLENRSVVLRSLGEIAEINTNTRFLSLTTFILSQATAKVFLGAQLYANVLGKASFKESVSLGNITLEGRVC
jgi:hypothetical protein